MDANKATWYYTWYEVWDLDTSYLLGTPSEFDKAERLAEDLRKVSPNAHVVILLCYAGGRTLVREYGDKHADTRDKKRFKKIHGMRVSARSIKSVLLPLIGKKAKKK